MSFIECTTSGLKVARVRYDCQTVCYRSHEVLLDIECGAEARRIRKCM